MAEALTLTYGYTAKDPAAVRAYVQREAPAIIVRRYHDNDGAVFAATPSAMEWHLRTMLDGLAKMEIEHRSPLLAEHLRSSIKQHDEPKLTMVTFRMVTGAPPFARFCFTLCPVPRSHRSTLLPLLSQRTVTQT